MNSLARELQPEEQQGQEEEFDRGIPSVNKNRAASVHRGVLAVTVVGALLGAGALAYMSYAKHAKEKAAQQDAKELQVNVPSKTFKLEHRDPLAAPPPPPPPPPPLAPTQPPPEAVQAPAPGTGRNLAFADMPPGQPPVAPRPRTPMPPLPVVDRGSSGLMVASASPSPAAQTAGAAAGQAGQRADDGGPLAAMLKSSSTQTRSAGLLRNRDYLLTKGTYVDCALQTKIDTTVAGMTMCVVTGDVYGDTGKILLVERGSQITGEYQANMTQGQSRVFVLWNRIKTPAGVVVDLDSPGVDPLGASGVEGYVNDHFWERFGGALMLSLVQDVGTAVANAVTSNAKGVTFNTTTSSAQGMAAEALRNTINIPPSLVKNQGDRVGILIARDLDFSTVYAHETEE